MTYLSTSTLWSREWLRRPLQGRRDNTIHARGGLSFLEGGPLIRIFHGPARYSICYPRGDDIWMDVLLQLNDTKNSFYNVKESRSFPMIVLTIWKWGYNTNIPNAHKRISSTTSIDSFSVNISSLLAFGNLHTTYILMNDQTHPNAKNVRRSWQLDFFVIHLQARPP